MSVLAGLIPYCGAAALALVFAMPAAEAQMAADVAGQLRESEIDPQASYRVRDLRLRKDDLSIYINDGFLAFSKPVHGRRVFAVYHASETGDHAEALVRPPDQGERASLANYTKSPILNEQVKEAVFISTDGSAEELLAAALESPSTKPYPDMGLLLGSRLNSVIRNIGSSFQVRMVHDILADSPGSGFLYAAMSGTALGNFDILFDPTNREQIVLGQVTSSPQGAGFNIWASFETRASRRTRNAPAALDRLENYRIESVIDPDFMMTSTTAADFKPKQTVKGALTFDIAPAMEIQSALVDGEPVEVFRREAIRSRLMSSRSNEQFLIVLKQPMEAGRTYRIEFKHRGKVILPAGNNVFFVASRVNWYPARESGHSTYDLSFTLPKHLTAVGSGRSDRGQGRGRDADGEMAHAGADPDGGVQHRRLREGCGEAGRVDGDGVLEPVGGDGAGQADAAGDHASAGMVGEGGRDAPAGRDHHDQSAAAAESPGEVRGAGGGDLRGAGVVCDAFRAAAAEHVDGIADSRELRAGLPGLLYLSTLTFLDEKERPESVRSNTLRLFYSEILSAHEAAHQWWGNLVGAATYHDEWISEALANYSAIMVLERRKGAKAADQVLEEGCARCGCSMGARAWRRWGRSLGECG
jgi:hypothetical protein